MKQYRYIIFTLLTLIINGCRSENKRNYHKIISPLNHVTKQLDLSDFVDSVNYIPLETSNNSLIGNPGKAVYCNHYFFISDIGENKILVFDQQGKYSHSIARLGRGPAEYAEISDFTVSPEDTTIFVGDSYGKINCYSFKGNYIKSFFTEKSILSINSVKQKIYISTDARVYLIDSTGTITHEFGHYDPKLLNRLNYISGGKIFPKNNSEFLFSLPYQDTIYKYSMNQITPKYVIDFGKHSIPEITPNNIQKLNETKLKGYAYLSSMLECKHTLYLWWTNNTNRPQRYFSIINLKNQQIIHSLSSNINDNLMQTDAQFIPSSMHGENQLIGINLPILSPKLAQKLKLNEDDNPIISIYHLK